MNKTLNALDMTWGSHLTIKKVLFKHNLIESY